MGTKGQSLAQCNLELSSRLRSMEETLKKRDEALEKTQQERDEARDKLAIVQRALETRLESYELNGSLHTGLLFEISKLQDHGEALALQLSQEQKRLSAIGAQLRSSQKREEELEDARTVRETWVATLEKERAALDEQLAQLSGDVQTAACEKATLLRFIHEQAEAKFQLEARLKDEQAQRRQEAERAQHALQLWEQERQQLKTNLQAARQEAEGQRSENERVLNSLREQQEVNATQRALEAEMELKMERLEAARRKNDEDFRAAKDVCRELQATIEQHEEGGRQLRAEIDALETARRDLVGQVDKKQSEERALREAMEGALQDLAALSKQRNDAAKAMSEAVTISASSLEEQQALERQVEEQRSQLEKLKSAKNLLQNAMLEQLAALRKQLHVERRQRIEAEARIKHLQPAAPRSRPLSSVLPPAEAEDVEARRPAEAADWETPQPLPPPSAPSPSPAPLPSYLSTRSASSSSSSSSSDEEDTYEALDQDSSPVEPPQRPIVPVQVECDAPISLLELAGSVGD
jgi:chromosome segregation ATPase